MQTGGGGHGKPACGTILRAMETISDQRQGQRAAVLSLVCGLLMLVLKMGAYLRLVGVTSSSDIVHFIGAKEQELPAYELTLAVKLKLSPEQAQVATAFLQALLRGDVEVVAAQ